jgi:AmiR/NasT family two-component response regulator
MTTARPVLITEPAHDGDDFAVALEEALAAIIDVTERFEARKVITHAKELLMSSRKMTEPEAYRWVQKTAMDRRTPMLSIAQTIVEGLGDNSALTG